MKEEWKDIQGYEGRYAISTAGRVLSTRPGFQKKILVPCLSPTGRHQVLLRRKSMLVHRLVAMAFIPNPEDKPEVNHIDSVPTNNCVENLEWVTHLENMQHAAGKGRFSNWHGDNNHNAKLTVSAALEIRAAYEAGGVTYDDLAKQYCISRTTVGDITTGKRWHTAIAAYQESK